MSTLLYRLRAWLAQVLAVEPGRPNDGLVELSAGTERDKPWSELSREFSDALEAWRFNPLARRIVGLVTAYVVGDGLVLRSPRPRVHTFLQAFQRDPDNNLLLEQAEWCDELTRSGEIFLALFARIDGSVVVRAVPASRIEKVDWEPGDYRAETSYHEVRDPGSDEGRVWRSPRAARAAGLRDGDKPLPIMLHYAVNRPVGCVRGESDLRPILEWLRRYSRWLEDRVSLNAAARAFVWVVRVPGRLVEAKAAQYRRPPAAGSVVVVDRDAEDWEAKAPGLAARDAASDGRAIRWMVAAGGPGLGLADFGEAEGANLATAEAMGEQRRRFLRRRQQLFGHILADLAVQAWNWTVDLGLRRGPAINEADVLVDLPDVAPSDNQALARAAREITLALRELRTLTGPSPALRTLALRLLLKFAGESVTEEEFGEIVAGGVE
jgi:hypothetical protein